MRKEKIIKKQQHNSILSSSWSTPEPSNAIETHSQADIMERQTTQQARQVGSTPVRGQVTLIAWKPQHHPSSKAKAYQKARKKMNVDNNTTPNVKPKHCNPGKLHVCKLS
jgi:hypothetical protein